MNIGSISRCVLRHKLLVGLIWIIVFIGAIALVPTAMGQLSDDFTMPGSESADAGAEIMARYGGVGGFSSPLVPVVELPDGTTVDDPGVQDELSAVFAAIQQARPDARVVSWASTGDDAFVSEDRQTTFGLVYLPSRGEAGVAGMDEVSQALADQTVAGEPVLLTGRPALSQVDESSGGAGVLVQTLIGAGGALVVLLYVFGSALAILPILIAAVSILTSFLVIGGMASLIDINAVVQYMVALIGLGIAIDYSLLVVTRWREEREAGFDNDLAVQRAMETAGHAVVFSGTTVGVGLLALIVLPIDMLRGIGIGGLVIPVISVTATITLLPIILATAGPKLDWPRRRRRHIHHGHGWERWSAGVVKHRWAAAILALVILGALLIPAFRIEIGEPRPDALNGPPEARAGMLALEHSGIDVGVLDPFEIVVEGDPAPVIDEVAGIDGVRGAMAPDNDHWRSDAGALIVALPQTNGSGSASREVMNSIRDITHGMDQRILVGGAAAIGGDFENDTYGQLPLMVLVISVVTLILLVRAFRSVILPLKAILLNIISVGASFGVLVMIWQWGWGSELIWGIPSSGSITNWVPIMAFAFLFGLSMDYEVFILSRMREEWDASGSNDTAIIRGLGFTGRLVTCAALILFLAFAAMAGTPETEIKILATVLATGILLDATIVRALLVPALVSLMGHWNWWMPSWLRWFAPKSAPLSGD